MLLTPGTRLGSYEILGAIGAGGMGEVYRATDTRLKRQVAVKTLPSALAVDHDRLARFQREAEVLASLNHPRIAAVYGLEDTADVKALVMELVEGPTLADRIAEGPIPIDEALSIARQIAEALEAAHEQGIIHRDLKPANIKVREDGSVKVLDFGLAKLVDTTAQSRLAQADLSASPTLTAAMTGMGVILGTAAYMSPEQARGRAIDKRSDVWAFGAVLYEMLTGARAFEGEDVTETMASVVKSTPSWSLLPADVPPQVVVLIKQCLEKDRNKRIGDIAVARFLLSDHAALEASPAPARHASSALATFPWQRAILWVVGAVVIGMVALMVIPFVIVAWLAMMRPPEAEPITRLQMNVAPADQLVGSTSSFFRPARTAIALSPDGRQVAFAGVRGQTSQLFVRALDRAEATPLAGTEGASAPFFSPDGKSIGFWADNKLKKVSAAGGPATVIAEVPGLTWGASWGEDSIFYATMAGIFKVSSGGGTPTAITKTDPAKHDRHLLPHVLPDDEAILFTEVTSEDWESARIVCQSLRSSDRRVVVTGGVDGRYVDTGHLAYMKNGTLLAMPFDDDCEEVSGSAVALIEGVMQGVNTGNTDDETGAGQFAISSSGTLVYVSGGVTPDRNSSLMWVDRKGAARPVAAVPLGGLGPRLSPNQQKIAVAFRRQASRVTDVWVYDMERGAPTRLTFDGGGSPIWSPDGKRILLAGLNIINADGTGKAERLVPGDKWQFPTSWASGANTVAFLQETQNGMNGIWALPMAGDRKPRVFLESRFELWHPDLSPDGRLMAYVSNESGTYEVYVQPYPGPGEKSRISTAGGFDPIWTANGKELLFRAATLKSHQFLSVVIRSTSPFRADTPRVLFETKPGEYDSTAPERSWDVSTDGERFLLVKVDAFAEKPVTTMNVVLNWDEELKRRVPTN
jgi:Tol biopolymer transport system component